jgi:branched-chain amino acid transport system substrate-binding protein
MSIKSAAGLAIALGAFLSTQAGAGASGVTKDQILLGQSAALKGSAAALGTGMQAGLNAFFTHVNGQGGINGRTIVLKTINDGYEPEKCVVATNALIDGDGVFALIGGVGTPTAKVALPICIEKKVPFIAAFTGAALLRDPYNANVVNFRASYGQEMEAQAGLLVDKMGLKKVACFYQNDPYGQSGLAAITKALEKRGMTLCASGQYERNTVAVADALAAIAGSEPDAIVMVGAYKACAQFIKSARAEAKTAKSVFTNLSFVGTDALAKELGADGEGVIISQVVPYPWDTSIPVVKEYQDSMKAAGQDAEVGFVSLEGYLAGKMFSQILAKVAGEPTRESFVAAATGTFDLGGVTLTFGPTDNQGMDNVYLTTIKGGKVVPCP